MAGLNREFEGRAAARRKLTAIGFFLYVDSGSESGRVVVVVGRRYLLLGHHMVQGNYDKLKSTATEMPTAPKRSSAGGNLCRDHDWRLAVAAPASASNPTKFTADIITARVRFVFQHKERILVHLTRLSLGGFGFCTSTEKYRLTH